MELVIVLLVGMFAPILAASPYYLDNRRTAAKRTVVGRVDHDVPSEIGADADCGGAHDLGAVR